MGNAREKQAKTGKNTPKTGAFLVLIFLGEKLVAANFYAFCNYELQAIPWAVVSYMVRMIQQTEQTKHKHVKIVLASLTNAITEKIQQTRGNSNIKYCFRNFTNQGNETGL